MEKALHYMGSDFDEQKIIQSEAIKKLDKALNSVEEKLVRYGSSDTSVLAARAFVSRVKEQLHDEEVWLYALNSHRTGIQHIAEAAIRKTIARTKARIDELNHEVARKSRSICHLLPFQWSSGGVGKNFTQFGSSRELHLLRGSDRVTLKNPENHYAGLPIGMFSFSSINNQITGNAASPAQPSPAQQAVASS